MQTVSFNWCIDKYHLTQKCCIIFIHIFYSILWEQNTVCELAFYNLLFWILSSTYCRRLGSGCIYSLSCFHGGFFVLKGALADFTHKVQFSRHGEFYLTCENNCTMSSVALGKLFNILKIMKIALQTWKKTKQWTFKRQGCLLQIALWVM